MGEDQPEDMTELALKAFYVCIDLPDTCWCGQEQREREDQMCDCHRRTLGPRRAAGTKAAVKASTLLPAESQHHHRF